MLECVIGKISHFKISVYIKVKKIKKKTPQISKAFNV